MTDTFLVITSISNDKHPGLQRFAKGAKRHDVNFILIGDKKSPADFKLPGCDYFSLERQEKLKFKLSTSLPYRHYARKNLGYLKAIEKGAKVIVESDDDNFPYEEFWKDRILTLDAYLIEHKGWVNVYKHFTDHHIWPRGFALERLKSDFPVLNSKRPIACPIQQGLADDNPDVDAIYRLTQELPVKFKPNDSLALGDSTFCPFNSQNTTWFKEAFPLMYLPSYCSFRMTDIWRSYVAQRIAWTCGWPILFHKSTVWQERNDHDLMTDFHDEVIGYQNAERIFIALKNLDLECGVINITKNMIICYEKLIELKLIASDEMNLLLAWISDIEHLLNLKDN